MNAIQFYIKLIIPEFLAHILIIQIFGLKFVFRNHSYKLNVNVCLDQKFSSLEWKIWYSV